MSSNAPNTAFSVIEVLLAMALFAITVYVLSQTFTNAFLSVESIRNSADSPTAIEFTKRTILLIPDRDTLEDGGDQSTPTEETVSWDVEIEETDIIDLFLCKLTMELEDQTYESSHYLLRPSWSETDERSQLLQEKTEQYQNDYRSNNF